MSLYDILNSVDLVLERNVKSYGNSFIDKFIDELKYYFFMKQPNFKNLDFDELPKDTVFYVDYIEEGYASCLDTNQKFSEKYEIPQSLLDDSIKCGGTYIQFDGKQYVNVKKPKRYTL